MCYHRNKITVRSFPAEGSIGINSEYFMCPQCNNVVFKLSDSRNNLNANGLHIWAARNPSRLVQYILAYDKADSRTWFFPDIE